MTLAIEVWQLVVPPMPERLSMPGKLSACFGTPNWKRTLSSAQFRHGVTVPWSTIAPANMLHFLATSRKMGWPLESYLQGDHPLQQEINRRVGEFLGLPAEELVAERDDCGAPTLLLQLSQMALLYAHLGSSTHAELEQISRAMLAHPKLVAGDGRFDTELMSRSHKQVISKGGAEGIQCLSRTGDGLGVAIKVEDGSRRAKQAVALHLLRQLDWITQGSLDELEDKMLIIGPGVRLEVKGELRA